MRHLFLIMLVFLSTLSQTTAAEVYRVRDRATIPFEKMLPDLRAADIIYVGELHQVEAHRRFVLDIIRELHAEDIPLAVGIEMFRADEQATLDAWTRGTLPLKRFMRAYADNWRLPWSIYDDMFLYAREHRIPLVGLSIPDEVSAAVARGGLASLTEQQRKTLPPGMSCTIDQKYREFIRKAYGDHGGIGPAVRAFLRGPDGVGQIHGMASLALPCGEPGAGTWRDRLAWDKDRLIQKRAHATEAAAKEAVARYRVIEQFSGAAVIEVVLVTGKRNQIRVQAGSRGWPLVGERLYTFGAPPPAAGEPTLDRQALHAARLSFIHPTTGGRVSISVPVPEDMRRLIENWRARRGARVPKCQGAKVPRC